MIQTTSLNIQAKLRIFKNKKQRKFWDLLKTSEK